MLFEDSIELQLYGGIMELWNVGMLECWNDGKKKH